MKSALCTVLSLLLVSAHGADWQEDYGRLLKKYVSAGGVRYAAWKATGEDLQAMHRVVEAIGSTPASGAKNKEQLAFLLNAYNAWILELALEKYPVQSIKDPLFTFFLTNRIVVNGEKMSFNHLEKDLIRARFGEPKIHFALNCASRSCPPLRNEPYQGANLDGQLEDQARIFINSPKGVIVSKDGARLSKIFDWYKEDFQTGVPAFLNARLPKPLVGSPKFSYEPYDWDLNEVK